MSEIPRAKPRSRILAYSLRSIFFIVCIVALVSAWLTSVAQKAKHEASVVARYNAQGHIYCNIFFDYQKGVKRTGVSRFPLWLRQATSENIFSSISAIIVSADDKLGIFDEDIDLSYVQYVSLRHCHLKNGLTCLRKCSQLTSLSIEGCSSLDVLSISQVSFCQKLRSLDFVSTQVKSLDVLRTLPELYELNIDGMNWNESAIDVLCDLKQLRKLKLRNAYMSMTDDRHVWIARLKKALSQTAIDDNWD
jgi:hypothetical protein